MSSTVQLHTPRNDIHPFTEDFLLSLHPPRTPLNFDSPDPAIRVMYLMLTRIWLPQRLDDLLICPKSIAGCIVYHDLDITRQGQLQAYCEHCDVVERVPTLSLLEWAVLRDGLRRWEAQEKILSRTIDLTSKDTDLTPGSSVENPIEIDLTDDTFVPLKFICSIIHPSAPFWLRVDDKSLKALYRILSYMRPEVVREFVICPNPPMGCRSFHVTTIDQDGRLYGKCQRCDLSGCRIPWNVSEYFKLQTAFLEWIDQDELVIQWEMEMIRAEVLELND
ncbi:hypothetical protein K435DRAFT_872617 [Dendrothele bispora CBS 962.96]|uniref:Uncharacterized protein n=1 Tax=Dendrothele bispora (strain CBS 962.96) TaxID=1314807 RepID=A0A4S8L1D3_DENBC|nr:hypothetical protein K435DRAFT_872617 [Dendrothele bispora CBS 962.96]